MITCAHCNFKLPVAEDSHESHLMISYSDVTCPSGPLNAWFCPGAVDLEHRYQKVIKLIGNDAIRAAKVRKLFLMLDAWVHTDSCYEKFQAQVERLSSIQNDLKSKDVTDHERQLVRFVKQSRESMSRGLLFRKINSKTTTTNGEDPEELSEEVEEN